MTLAYLTVILFLLMDPVGNISSFLFLLKDVDPARRVKIIMREMSIALAAMVAFYFLGEIIFSILKVSETAIRLASGLILFLVAIKILFPSLDSLRANLPVGEPFISPLAIPLIAGPSLLATIMLFSHLETSHAAMLGAIFISWLLAALILLSGARLQRLLGVNGLMACERLMALVLVMISIQRFLEGLRQFVKACQ
jgi:multiple antibiotic resistance protein